MSDVVRRLARTMDSEGMARTDGSGGECVTAGKGNLSSQPSQTSSSDHDQA